MPASPDPGDRKLLIGAGALLLVLVMISALASPPSAQSTPGIPSSYSPAWDGAEAAFLLLKDMGYPVERWEQPPTAIPGEPSRTVLILSEPLWPASAEERQAIHQFLRAGGRVLATGKSAAWLLPEAAVKPAADPWNLEPKPYQALVPSPIAHGAPEISMVAAANWAGTQPSQLIVYGDGGSGVVVTYRSGKGRAIWWAAPTPLTNGEISNVGNLALLLNSVGPPGATRVLWDEYFHGVRGSLWAYVARTPLPWAAVQVGVILLAIIGTFSRHWSPVRAPASESRLVPLEFVETLGDLYHTAHASAAAVGIAYGRFRFLLTRQLGIPANARVPDLCRSARQQLSWQEPALQDTLAQAERGMRTLDLPESQALELVQRLYDYTARLQGRRRDKQEAHGWP